jgi:hypothetical protein
MEITVSPSKAVSFPLRLRIPRWCQDPTLSVNDQAVAGISAGSLFVIERQWQPGDRVVLTLPMLPRLVKGRVAQAGRAAIMYGPLVMGLSRANIRFQGETAASDSAKAQSLDLRAIFIDPDSLQGPIQRPTSPDIACSLNAWSPGRFAHRKTDLVLTFTPHADPEGEAIYFKLPNPNHGAVVNDELLFQEQEKQALR